MFGARTEDDVESGFIESTVGKEYSLCVQLRMSQLRRDICASGYVNGSQ